MNPRAVAVESASFRLVARVNGRVRCPIFLFRIGDDETPVLVEDLNTAASADRDRFLAMLPNALPTAQRDEVAPLLTRLASQVAAASIEAGKSASREEATESGELAPWTDPVEGVAVLNETCALVRRYVVVSTAEAVAIALWTAHTYLADEADYTPYLHVSSPVRECGKSTALELLLHVAFRARKTDSITPAAVYRLIHQSRPTLLLDELDTRLHDEGGDAFKRVLNSGFARGGNATICVGDNHDVQDFRTFCPKVLAGIGRLWDTVSSRSIPIRLTRASKEELARLAKIRGHLIAGECLPYRQRLLRLADDVRLTVRIADPSIPSSLGARQADVWRPLLAIADAVGGPWPDMARAAAAEVYGTADDENDTALILLADLRAIFVEHDVAVMPSARIVAELVQREDRPWPEYRHDKPITTKGLASLLQRFGVRPKQIRFGAETAKGYELDKLRSVFQKYLSPESTSVSDVSGRTGVAGSMPAHDARPQPSMIL